MKGAQTVEVIGIEKLIPYVKNSRTHSDEQVAQIAASIKEFGFNNPVLIGEDVYRDWETFLPCLKTAQPSCRWQAGY